MDLRRLPIISASYLLSLPKTVKLFLLVIVDVSLCCVSIYSAFWLRLGYEMPFNATSIKTICVAVTLQLSLFFYLGHYREYVRHLNLHHFRSLIMVFFVYGLLFSLIFTLIQFKDVPRSIGLIHPMLLLILTTSARYCAVSFLSLETNRDRKTSNAVIVRANKEGVRLASALSASGDIKIKAFIETNSALRGRLIDGYRIEDLDYLNALVDEEQVDEILIPSSGVQNELVGSIVERARNKNITIRRIPINLSILDSVVKVSDIPEFDILELIGRPSINPDEKLISADVSNKVVFVSGAGGSIGSELCRQIIRQSPRMLILVDHSESALYSVFEELKTWTEKFQFVDIKKCLLNVLDKERLLQLMIENKPDTVYHAAAYKHVSIVEENFRVGVENNVFGSCYLAEAAIKAGVKKFVLISTDKAVSPKNLMGASKRLSELLLLSMFDVTDNIVFSIVRFGNVLGSSGSVVPKFKKQIEMGGPVTVTDPNVTRYFMTIPEAAQLVIQAGAMSKGAEIYILDMGKPVKILELAKRMISFYAARGEKRLKPSKEIEIVYTGLQRGEKMHEILTDDDELLNTSHPRIFYIRDQQRLKGGHCNFLQSLDKILKTGDYQSISKFVYSEMDRD